ncbi:MAG: hypothetical protein LAT67_02470 [Balneolales bacterium]|nr:hypothetical protein [Balneolales bacterium]
MKQLTWIDLGIGFLFVLAQISIFNHLDIFNIRPSMTLLFVLWLCMVRTRTYVLLVSGLIAVLMDILTDSWGVYLFSTSLTVLIFHTFIKQQAQNKLLPGQAFLTAGGISLVYHLFFLFISEFAGLYDTNLLFLKYWLGLSLYTSVAASIAYMLLPD